MKYWVNWATMRLRIDGSGNKTIDGGAGTDSISINLSGHTSLSDLVFLMQRYVYPH